MRLIEMKPGWSAFTQLSSTALAVVVRREDGWCVYAGGVPGIDHKIEWEWVRDHGDKMKQAMAEAVCRHLFHPPIETEGLEYAW